MERGNEKGVFTPTSSGRIALNKIKIKRRRK
jgi:hypothetical protein